MKNVRSRAAIGAAGVLLAVLLGAGSASASVCWSGNKLDLDICSGFDKPSNPPIYKPEFEKPWEPKLPNPSPTVVTPHDSRGRTIYGPGIIERF